jgi:hypothetical protein
MNLGGAPRFRIFGQCEQAQDSESCWAFSDSWFIQFATSRLLEEVLGTGYWARAKRYSGALGRGGTIQKKQDGFALARS